MKTFSTVFIFLFTMSLTSCKSFENTLDIKCLNQDIEVVQQIPVTQNGRAKNTLYLPPRRISDAEFNSPKLQELIDCMYAVMIKKAGVGIAANQIGKRLQLFIIEAKADNPRYKVLGPVLKQVFINPVITKVSETRKNFWHGCLSAEGQKRGNVATYEWIEYRAQNEKGAIQTGRLDGFAAVIFQHEFRHLLTGTYLDVAHQFMDKPELDYQIKAGKIPFFETISDTLPLLIKGYTVGQTLDDYHGVH